MLRTPLVDPEELRRRLGASVRLHRQNARLSQEELARRLELSRTTVANIEAGRQALAVEQLYRIAAVVRVDPAELLPRDGRRPDAPEMPEMTDGVQRLVLRLKKNSKRRSDGTP